MMKATRAIALATALLLAGCTFVKLTDAGAGVSQATAADAANCDRVGIVSTTTRDRVGIKRGSAKVQEELTVLGRNEAAGLGRREHGRVLRWTWRRGARARAVTDRGRSRAPG